MKKLAALTLLGVSTLSLSLAGCGLGTATVPDVNANHGLGLNLQTFRADGVARAQVLVSFKGAMDASALKSFEGRTGVKVRRSMSAINSALVGISTSPESALTKLKADPSVAVAEFDRALLLDAVTVNDPSRAKQYALDKVNANEAWTKTMGSDKVVVGIVDSGVDLEHPDLKAKLLPGGNTVSPGQPPKDDVGHGTHVAGIAAAIANNNEGIAGLAPGCKILPVKVLGAGAGSTATVAEGLIWAADHGADVVNMSLGFYDKPDTVAKAIEYALSKNVVLVATMGNDNIERQRFPAAFPGVIAVGSTDQKDAKSSFSNYGSWMSVSAPGSDIFSTFPTYPVSIGGTPGYTNLSGTSMAAPLVAGLCALIRSAHPGMPPAQVKALLESTAADLGDKGFDKFFGNGRIDAKAALLK